MLETRILKARVESLYMFRSLFSIAYPLCRSSSPILLSLYWADAMPVAFSLYWAGAMPVAFSLYWVGVMPVAFSLYWVGVMPVTFLNM